MISLSSCNKTLARMMHYDIKKLNKIICKNSKNYSFKLNLLIAWIRFMKKKSTMKTYLKIILRTRCCRTCKVLSNLNNKSTTLKSSKRFKAEYLRIAQ